MFLSNENRSQGASPLTSLNSTLQSRFSLSYAQERDRPMPDPIGTPLSAKRKTPSESPSPAQAQMDKADSEVAENRKYAFEMLKKIVEGQGSSLSKSQVTRLLNILNADKEILPMIEVTTQDFGQIVDSQPDLAAEILVQLHAVNSVDVYK